MLDVQLYSQEQSDDCGKVSHVEEMYRDFSIALPEDER
jgi:hypothetical protein